MTGQPDSADLLGADAPRRFGLRELGGLALRPALEIGRLGWRTSGRVVEAATVATVDAVLSGPLVERVTDAVLRDEAIERVVDRVLRGPELERIADAVLASPAMERVVGRAIESRLFDAALTRLLESEELWRVIDEIARSPAVTDAITQQGLGFADQVAGGVRSRSRDADDWLERTVRRALRRRPPTAEGPSAA